MAALALSPSGTIVNLIVSLVVSTIIIFVVVKLLGEKEGLSPPFSLL